MTTLSFPQSFVLPNLRNVTGGAFESRVNCNQLQASDSMTRWFEKFTLQDKKRLGAKFVQGSQFGLLTALTFPGADLEHLETCFAFYLWAFAGDDLFDEGSTHPALPEDLRAEIDLWVEIVRCQSDAPAPESTYGSMILDIAERMRSTASPALMNRFSRAVKSWGVAQLNEQSSSRSIDKLHDINGFIILRRATIGADMAIAMLEYALQLDLPEEIFRDPDFARLLDAAADIVTISNDLCSFNKEQANGEYHNLVCVVMKHHSIELQAAINLIVCMIKLRVAEFLEMKNSLTNSEVAIDGDVERYIKAAEYYVQGTLIWYYHCPRYFRDLNVLGKDEVEIPVFQKEISY